MIFLIKNRMMNDEKKPKNQNIDLLSHHQQVHIKFVNKTESKKTSDNDNKRLFVFPDEIIVVVDVVIEYLGFSFSYFFQLLIYFLNSKFTKNNNKKKRKKKNNKGMTQ